MASAVNETVRDNVFYMPGIGTSTYAILGAQRRATRERQQPPVTGRRGLQQHLLRPHPAVLSQSCIGLRYHRAAQLRPPAATAIAQEQPVLRSGERPSPAVHNTGSREHRIEQHRHLHGTNPGFTNASGNFSVISDFKPTGNDSGAMTVPVWSDALGVLWSSGWNLGALHQ